MHSHQSDATPQRLEGLTETEVAAGVAYTAQHLPRWRAEPHTDFDKCDPKGYPETILYFVQPTGGNVTRAGLYRRGGELFVALIEYAGEFVETGPYLMVDDAMATLRGWIEDGMDDVEEWRGAA